jgi:hypothetical protein
MRNGYVHGPDELFRILRQSLAILHQAFEVALDGFSDIRFGFLQGFALAVARWQGGTKRVIATAWFGLNDNREAIDMRGYSSFHRFTLSSQGAIGFEDHGEGWRKRLVREECKSLKIA